MTAATSSLADYASASPSVLQIGHNNGILQLGASILTAAIIDRAWTSTEIAEWVDAGMSSSSTSWGSIAGTLSNQVDLQTALDAKAALTHAHTIANVTGLQAALDAKLDDGQATTFGLSLLDDADAATARSTLGLGTAAVSAATAFATASHTHSIANVTGLQAALDAKLDDSQATVFGLSLLDDADAATARATLGLGSAATSASTAFAAASHAHAITDVTGLQAALDAKAASSHSHVVANITDYVTATDARIAAASINALADVVITTPSSGQVLKWNGSNWVNDTDATGAGGGGSGDVVGPASATDNAVARFDLATGKLVQNSTVVISDAGEIALPLVPTPVAPAADKLNLFTQKSAGRMRPRMLAPTGPAVTLQSHLGRNRIATAQAVAGANTVTTNGMVLSTTGTLTAVTPVQTNAATRLKRAEYLVTTAAVTAVAGWRGSTAQWTIGDPSLAEHGGFDFVCDWTNATGAATASNRCFVGMANSTAAPTDVEPSSITNIVGMGWDAADANIQFMHRGAGAVTKIDLGANFPVPTTDRNAGYRLEMWSPPGTTQALHYKITNLINNQSAEGTITTNLPTSATYLAPRGWMSVGGTSSVIGIALANLYIESDW